MKWIIALLLLASCRMTPPQPVEDTVQVIIFSAPWCSMCRHEILASHGQYSKQIHFTVRVGTGANPAEKPDMFTVEQYRKDFPADIQLNMMFIPDDWPWQTYKKYFSDNYALPAAVVIDSKGAVLKTFGPGFIQPDLGNYLKKIVH
jgi:hypothetical protein